MNTIEDRLRLLREHWQVSQRQMAAKVKLTSAAWQHYENGSAFPGGQVLASLLELGVNINWVLSGRGEMFLEPQPDSRGRISQLLPVEYKRLVELVEELGLQDLLSASELSFFGNQASVLRILSLSFPDAVSIKRLEAECGALTPPMDRRALSQVLSVLEQRGLIESPASGAYRLLKSDGELVFKDMTGHADLCLRAIRALVQDILPRATMPSGFLLNVKLTTNQENGEKLVDELRHWLTTHCTEATIDGAPDTASVVVGIAFAPSSN